MKRMMYRAQWKPGQTEAGLQLWKALAPSAQRLADDGEIMTIAGYGWEQQLFIYCECIGREWRPDDIFPELRELLADWPGQSEFRKWVPLADVFHFNEPASVEHWMRKQPVERRVGRVAHLRPEMIASYIYYHYQLQEERAFLGDKYEIIGIHENLMFGYQEFPKVIEEPITPKKLATEGTPRNWNDSRMDLHFQPWPDGHLYFKPIDQIFAIYAGNE